MAGKFLQVVFLFLSLLASFVAPAATTKCAKGAHIIAVRGHAPAGQGQGKPSQGYGITIPLLNAIKGAIPHSTNESISYPKQDSVNEENQIATGKVHAAVAKSVKACPKTPVIIYGYSNGATITMNSICGTSSLGFTRTSPLDPKFTKNVIGTIVYADGTYQPGKSWDKLSCKRPGSFPRLNSAACDPYASVIQSYCQPTDPYCCVLGSSGAAHYTYFKDFDARVANFLAAQFKKHKG